MHIGRAAWSTTVQFYNGEHEANTFSQPKLLNSGQMASLPGSDLWKTNCKFPIDSDYNIRYI